MLISNYATNYNVEFTNSFLDKFVICGAIALIGFRTYNLSVATFAQQESPTGERSYDLNDLLFTLVDHQKIKSPKIWAQLLCNTHKMA